MSLWTYSLIHTHTHTHIYIYIYIYIYICICVCLCVNQTHFTLPGENWARAMAAAKITKLIVQSPKIGKEPVAQNWIRQSNERDTSSENKARLRRPSIV